MGRALPGWLRERLLVQNGFELDDGIGVTGKTWRMLPVMDRSSRSRMSRTAEDIAWHTTRARDLDRVATPGFGAPEPGRPVPSEAVVIGHAWSPELRLLLLPSADDPTVFGTDLFLQAYLAVPEPLGVTLPQFAPSPESLPVGPDEPLPSFRYHPDPVATGMIRRSPNACAACRQRRGWEYTTTPYGARTLAHVCPWCIVDGTAAAAGASFSDGWPLLEADLAEEIVTEVTRRTPGFASFQQEEWQSCCQDACAFVGALSAAQIAELPAELRAEHDLPDALVAALRETENAELAVFGFRCLHCDAPKVWLDFP